MKVAGIVLFISVVLFSCSPKLSPDQNWAEGKWILTELKEVPVQISGNSNKDAHLEFKPSNKSYTGFGGCNSIGGSYTLSKGKIKFSPGSAKQAGCPDVPFETTFLSLLNQVDKYDVNGNIMILKDGNKTVIKLERK
jgi:heat shock protein HslJ